MNETILIAKVPAGSTITREGDIYSLESDIITITAPDGSVTKIDLWKAAFPALYGLSSAAALKAAGAAPDTPPAPPIQPGS